MDLLKFAIISLIIVIASVLISYVFEVVERKKSGSKRRILYTRKVVGIGVMSAIAAILYIFDFPLFFIPSFYKIDFSLVPALLCGFAYGPVAGVLTELLRVVIKLLIKGTSTAYVGDLASFTVGMTMVLPATLIYQAKKKKSTALIGCIAGVVIMTMFGGLFNAFYLIPTYITMFFKGNEQALIGAAAAVNPKIKDLKGIVFFGAVPASFIKGSLAALITMLIYKPLRPILKKTRD